MGYTKKRKVNRRKRTTRRKTRGGQRYVKNTVGKFIPNPSWGKPTSVTKGWTNSLLRVKNVPKMPTDLSVEMPAERKLATDTTYKRFGNQGKFTKKSSRPSKKFVRNEFGKYVPKSPTPRPKTLVTVKPTEKKSLKKKTETQEIIDEILNIKSTITQDSTREEMKDAEMKLNEVEIKLNDSETIQEEDRKFILGRLENMKNIINEAVSGLENLDF
jgi:hypothetical protein